MEKQSEFRQFHDGETTVDEIKMSEIYNKLSLDDLRDKLKTYKNYQSSHKESNHQITIHIRLLEEAISSKEKIN